MQASCARHVAKGFCRAGCGRLLATKTMCRKCADKMRDTQKTHIKKGLCQSGCGRPLVTKTACFECSSKARHRSRTSFDRWAGNKANAQRSQGRAGITKERIKKIWERQQGCCAITGEELVFGSFSASLDHIKSVADGGTDDLSNLRIVHYDINVAKHKKTDPEFAELILKLYPWACKVQQEEQERAYDNDEESELDEVS